MPRGCRGASTATSAATPASARRWTAWPACEWCARSAARGTVTTQHSAEFVFQFVLDGGITLQRANDEPLRLAEGDSFVMPAHTPYTLSEPTADLQILDVTLPDLI